ncbi:MAG: type IX secretion system outer membrane channel protein PorV [Chitinophagales bacterium]|nr:type IX secretion system outer membrane channel protein PorV [Bacteroidota bacterium]
MNFFRISLVTVFLSILNTAQGNAQITTGELDGRVNTVFTGMPFLRINPDARAGGMGDVGLATSPDAASIYFNMSKLAFSPFNSGISLTYTPWLSNLVDDIFIAHVAGYHRLDEQQAIAGSLRYFSLGKILFTDINNQNQGEFNPLELAFDFGYTRRLSDNFSAGITLKYFNSNLAGGQVVNGVNIKAANGVAADISVYNQRDIFVGTIPATFAWGAAITNIGNKISYTEEAVRDFIPINLGVGTSLSLEFDEYNKLNFAFDINKLMVPTPVYPIILDENGVEIENPEYDSNPANDIADYREKSLLDGMFGSFTDAPGGGKEELRELMYSFGVEYWYNDQFAVRAGHFNEHKLKGNRKYINLGIGLKYNIFGFNFAYLVSTSSIPNNPLENTLRFSLTFDLGEEM